MPTRFRISDEVSNRPWGEVDKSRIWRILKQTLEEGGGNAAEAIREVYAAVRAPINRDLTQDDVWGPHHEISDDGVIRLNRNGLIAAAQALAGARAEPNLTAEQKAAARRHLLRHYRALEMEPPPSLAGEAVLVVGEMAVRDVQIAHWADLAKLTASDPQPLQFVASIRAGFGANSRRHYGPEALDAIAEVVRTEGLPIHVAHPSADYLASGDAPAQVGVWIGAERRGDTLYLRGLLNTPGSMAKRLVKEGAIKSVSLFGLVTEERDGKVVGFVPLSVDLVPPAGRPGMNTEIVAVGETVTDGNGGERKMQTVAEILAGLKDALNRKDTTWARVIGEMGVKFEDLAREIGGEAWSKLQDGVKAIGEMAGMYGLGAEAKVAELVEKVKAEHKLVGEIRSVLGVDEKADVVAAAKAAREAADKLRAAEFEALVGKVLAEMVLPGRDDQRAKDARQFVREALNLQVGADEAAVKKAVGELLGKEHVKRLLNSAGIEFVPNPVNPNPGTGNAEPTANRRAIPL